MTERKKNSLQKFDYPFIAVTKHFVYAIKQPNLTLTKNKQQTNAFGSRTHISLILFRFSIIIMPHHVAPRKPPKVLKPRNIEDAPFYKFTHGFDDLPLDPARPFIQQKISKAKFVSISIYC